MELTPQLLTDEIDFRIAVRGYDRHEVDDFLERVAVAVGQLQSQLTKAVGRARTAEARLAELEGASDATTTVTSDEPAESAEPEVATAEATAEVESAAVEREVRGAGAPPPPAPVAAAADDADLDGELRRTLVLAQRTADLAIREAREEAAGIVAAANDDAQRMRSEASEASAREREEARARLLEEIGELEATREALRSDSQILDRYLGTERARVRETIQVLRRLVDEPERFRPAAPPELSGVAAPREIEAASEEADEDVVTRPTEPEVPEDPDAVVAEESVDEPGSEPTPAAAVETPQDDGERLGKLFDTGEGHRDWRASGPARGDQGPHTEPVAAARFEEESDDAFLAELRRAMNDDEPLGPGGTER